MFNILVNSLNLVQEQINQIYMFCVPLILIVLFLLLLLRKRITGHYLKGFFKTKTEIRYFLGKKKHSSKVIK